MATERNQSRRCACQAPSSRYVQFLHHAGGICGRGGGGITVVGTPKLILQSSGAIQQGGRSPITRTLNVGVASIGPRLLPPRAVIYCARSRIRMRTSSIMQSHVDGSHGILQTAAYVPPLACSLVDHVQGSCAPLAVASRRLWSSICPPAWQERCRHFDAQSNLHGPSLFLLVVRRIAV